MAKMPDWLVEAFHKADIEEAARHLAPIPIGGKVLGEISSDAKAAYTAWAKQDSICEKLEKDQDKKRRSPGYTKDQEKQFRHAYYLACQKRDILHALLTADVSENPEALRYLSICQGWKLVKLPELPRHPIITVFSMRIPQ
jgi:hypothetical protein